MSKKVICGWCGKYIGEQESKTTDDSQFEGICDYCLNYYFPHHADLIRACLEVENIETIFVSSPKV